jgi:hypothetical protein
MAGAPSHCSALDGIHNTQALKVGGVTVLKELERLWNNNILIQKKKWQLCSWCRSQKKDTL